MDTHFAQTDSPDDNNAPISPQLVDFLGGSHRKVSVLLRTEMLNPLYCHYRLLAN
ncbi:hypothetical protein AG1IA_09960 [Rhizoctonia solani AG-1 IA]|uniref:Uncharacterized protein n=1 Tax=Thanatephorus cucumeris (strain AG1-IA) TaxID=983506 RepID=L8WCV4_THACA|nr:hypothetical protein AG1IA_09960 [Rhizoctonia solani AG-1 IA]